MLACAALALIAAGCGGMAKGKHPSAMQGRHGVNGSSFHDTRKASVAIRDDGFHPRVLRVRVKTAVRWTNRGSRVHTVRWTSGRIGRFSSPPLKPGDSFLIRFARVARVTYRSTAPGDRRFRGVIVTR